jgi:hypothetical protein
MRKVGETRKGGPGPNAVLAWIRHLSQSPRPAGSKEDAQARADMRAVIESTGRFAVEEGSFDFESYVPWEWALVIDGEEVDTIFTVCSASTQRGGLHARLRRSDSKDLEGSVALLRISDIHESVAVEDLARRGAIGVLAFQNRGHLLIGRVKYPRSSVPCLMIDADLGERLWERSRGKRPAVDMTVRAETAMAEGRNLFALPRDAPAQTLFTAHRDSRPLSPGAIDNGSGSAFLLFLAEASRTPGFGILSTDAEEYGLLGAKAFVKAPGPPDSTTDVANLDSIGSGPLHLVERSRAGPLSQDLNARIERVAKDVGVHLSRLSIPKGSDSDVFMEAGIRSCWVRSYPTPTATTIEDTAAHLDLKILDQCCVLLRSLAAKVSSSDC